MTTVIGDEDNGWSSATMVNGELIDQHKDKVQDIHQHATTTRLTPVDRTHPTFSGMLYPSEEQVVDALKSNAGNVNVCTNPLCPESGCLSHQPISCEGGICMSAGKISVTCEKHQKQIDSALYPHPKWAPPVSRLEEEKSMLKELNKPQPSPDESPDLLFPSPDWVKKSPTSTSPKSLDSSHKIPVNLCPASAIIAIAMVISLGHKKPGRSIYNWRTQPISYSEYLGAAQRHMLKSNDGSDYDPELTKLAGVNIRHDWAAMSCLAIIEDARQAGTLVDDRPVKGGAEEFLESLMVKK